MDPYAGLLYIGLHSYRVALDNHDPVPRKEGGGYVEHWLHQDTEQDKYVLHGLAQFKQAPRAVFLLDNGRTVIPLYVAGWHYGRDTLILHTMPVDVYADGEPRIRPDNGRPVDMSGWMLGPRTTYHLKITEV